MPERELYFDRRQESHVLVRNTNQMGDGDGGGADMAVELEAGLNADRDREISEMFH